MYTSIKMVLPILAHFLKNAMLNFWSGARTQVVTLNAKEHEPTRRGAERFYRIYFFISRQAGKVKRNGVKDGATLQIHNFCGPAGDFRAVSGERAPGGYCGPAGSYHGDDLPGVEARGNRRRGRRAGSGPEPAAGLQPGYRPADGTGEFQAAGPDPGGRARRFQR